MKTHMALTSALALLFLTPAAAADISILGGTAIIHTDGDPGLSVLGDPLARVDASRPCFDLASCVVVYSDPAGTGENQVLLTAGPCTDWDQCLLVSTDVPLSPVDPFAFLMVGDNVAILCLHVLCTTLETDPLCVTVNLVGEIVCDT